MIYDPRPTLRTRLRAYLGTDILTRMENTMSEITDSLNRLAEQVNGVSAAQATSFHNLQVALNELKDGKLTAEQKDIVGRIETALTKLGEDAQTADDGFEPAETPGTPTDTTPAVEPDADGDVIPNETGRSIR